MKPTAALADRLFQIPTWHLIGGYSLAALALSLGICLSIYLHDWMWLARFGAFLVCLALMFEITGLPERFVGKALAIAEEATVETVFKQMLKHSYLYGITEETTDEQLSIIFDKEHRRRLAFTSNAMTNAIKKKIQKHEFIIASIGTLLWAFADLLNKL